MLTFAAIGLAVMAAGTGLAMWARRSSGASSPGQVFVVNPVVPGGGGSRTGGGQPGQVPPSIIGVPKAPDPAPGPAAPGAEPGNPTYSPEPGRFYWVQFGDTGTGIVTDAYSVPAGSGNRVRAWESVRKNAVNRALSKTGADTWSGDLLPQHEAPGQHRFGTGKKLPVVWLPPLGEVTW